MQRSSSISYNSSWESSGQLIPHANNIIFEGTSGSTGISLAILCNALGYICHICLPDDTSLENYNY